MAELPHVQVSLGENHRLISSDFLDGTYGAGSQYPARSTPLVLRFPVYSNTSAIKFLVVSNGTAVTLNGDSRAPGSSCSGDNTANKNKTNNNYYDSISCEFPRTGYYWVVLASNVKSGTYGVTVTATNVVCASGKTGATCQYSKPFPFQLINKLQTTHQYSME